MKLYIGNLSNNVTEQDLQNLFSEFGQVTSATIIKDKFTGQSRGFGFVEMDSEGANKAIENLDNKDVQGQSIKVSEARPRPDRPGGRGGFGGGSRGRFGGGDSRGGRMGGGGRPPRR